MENGKPRMGRPPKDGAAKGVRIDIRVSEEERDEWDRAALAEGVGRSDWMRRILNRAAKRRRK